MTGTRAWAASLLLLTGCDSSVHIRLSAGDDPAMGRECTAAVLAMSGFYVELARDELILKKCVDMPRGLGQPTSLAELEGLLSQRVAFDDVPADGRWTVWVEGFSTKDCSKSGAPLLCGAEQDLSMPPPDGEIVVTVTCSTKTWTLEGLESCRFK